MFKNSHPVKRESENEQEKRQIETEMKSERGDKQRNRVGDRDRDSFLQK